MAVTMCRINRYLKLLWKARSLLIVCNKVMTSTSKLTINLGLISTGNKPTNFVPKFIGMTQIDRGLLLTFS